MTSMALIEPLISFFGNLSVLFTVTTISIIVKIYLLAQLINQRPQTALSKKPWFLLALVLISAIIIDFAWIMVLIKFIWLPDMDFRFLLLPLRFSWGFFVIQYQALTLFVESLIASRTTLRHKMYGIISSLFFLFPIGLALIDINCQNPADRPQIEFIMRTMENIYILLLLVPSCLLITLWKLRNQHLPRILEKQLKIFIPTLILPLWLCDIFQMFPLPFSPTWTTNSYAAATFTTLLITFAVFYCARRMMTLRFLNLKEQVQSATRFNFIDSFKNVLEQLSLVTNSEELRHITQTFFKDSFNIPLNKTRLYIRKSADLTEEKVEALPQGDSKLTSLVENFLLTQSEDVISYIASTKILIYDELTFSNFYEEKDASRVLVQFMATIDADIFLPIYEKNSLVAYVIVERHTRPNEFYGNIEHDEMIVFSKYLGNIINLLQTRNLQTLIQQEKELQEELYLKHQELNQYKESIRSFLRGSQQKEIGIVFYKNRQFIFGNKAAKELIHVNINTHEGHPLTKAFKLVARHVQDYKTPYTSFAHDKDGNKIVLSGVPNLEQNNCIITIYYPEISDIIKRELDLLQDPSKWDYLLYLETTRSGKLINQLIPGTGEKLLNFKISLLQVSLSKKAILLEMAEEDLLPTVEIIHHINLRETLHIMKLQTVSRNHDLAVKLFGINPLFGIDTSNSKPLLEQLDETGTLFIQNIHLLDLETQDYLAEFIRYGFYRIYKSDQKIISNVRIICSTQQNLQTLVHDGLFSKKLFNELKKTSLSMPSLTSLPDDELGTLADGFIEQTVKGHDLKNLLDLSDKEKLKLAFNRPVSLHELKERIQQLLVNKSKKNHIYHETQFDPAYQLADPQLIAAARLGKHALKDYKIMLMLWEKFKSQAKIASFLGVNRSSVNRRCKEFNIEQ